MLLPIKWAMEVLANTKVIITMQYVYQINTLNTLHNTACQLYLYLNKAVEKVFPTP